MTCDACRDEAHDRCDGIVDGGNDCTCGDPDHDR